MKHDQVCIFDFDGTIADTFATSIRIFEKMTKKKPYKPAEIERLRGLSGLQLIRELRIRPWLVPFMLARGRAMMRRKMKDIEVFPGVEKVIHELHAQGVPLYIMSSNSPANIRKFLRDQGLADNFIRIYGNVGLFGKSAMLRRVMRQNGLQPQQVTYIGDESRDIEAAKHVNVRIVSVDWGFNSADLLARHKPDVIVHSPRELAKALSHKSGKVSKSHE